MITLVFSHAGMKLLWFNYIYVYGFFYVAGYTFREKPFLKFVKSKILGLYIPFIANCLIGLLILFALSKVSHGYFFSRELLDTNIFLIQIPHNLFAPAWFIFPFFIIQFVFFALKKTVKNCNAIFGISFLLYVISYVFNDFLCRFQWNNCAWLVNVLLGTFVFSCGHVLRNNDKIFNVVFHQKYAQYLFAISTIYLLLTKYILTYQIDLRIGLYDNFIFNTLVIFSGMIFLFYLAKLIKQTNSISKILVTVGQHTSAIMYFHVISFSAITLPIHYFSKLPFPNTWSNSYNTGWLILLNGLAGICLPLMFSMMAHNVKSRCRCNLGLK